MVNRNTYSLQIWGNRPRDLLDGYQERSSQSRAKKSVLFRPEAEPQSLGRLERNLVTLLTANSVLLNYISFK